MLGKFPFEYIFKLHHCTSNGCLCCCCPWPKTRRMARKYARQQKLRQTDAHNNRIRIRIQIGSSTSTSSRPKGSANNDEAVGHC